MLLLFPICHAGAFAKAIFQQLGAKVGIHVERNKQKGKKEKKTYNMLQERDIEEQSDLLHNLHNLYSLTLNP